MRPAGDGEPPRQAPSRSERQLEVSERQLEVEVEVEVQAEPQTWRGDERGSGTVLMINLVVLAGLLIAVILSLEGAIVTRHRAGAAADLAALAAVSNSAGAVGPLTGSNAVGPNGLVGPNDTVGLNGVGRVSDVVGPDGASGVAGAVGAPDCAQAGRVATANRGRLVACRPLADGSVVVEVESTAGRLALFGTALASARAGPGAYSAEGSNAS